MSLLKNVLKVSILLGASTAFAGGGETPGSDCVVIAETTILRCKSVTKLLTHKLELKSYTLADDATGYCRGAGVERISGKFTYQVNRVAAVDIPATVFHGLEGLSFSLPSANGTVVIYSAEPDDGDNVLDVKATNILGNYDVSAVLRCDVNNL